MIDLQAKVTDTEWWEQTILKVEDGGDPATGWAVTMDDGWSIVIENVGLEPQVGDTIRLYGEGWGRPVRGIDLNGQTVRYRTIQEQKLENERQLLEMQRGWERAYSDEADDLEAKIVVLPRPFIDRIQRFRRVHPVAFDVQYLAYEVFCCQEAVKIAAHCQDEQAVIQLANASWDEQAQVISNGHSGNTAHSSFMLAFGYLTQPETLWQLHGALCAIVGCQNYGCFAAYPDITPAVP